MTPELRPYTDKPRRHHSFLPSRSGMSRSSDRGKAICANDSSKSCGNKIDVRAVQCCPISDYRLSVRELYTRPNSAYGNEKSTVHQTFEMCRQTHSRIS